MTSLYINKITLEVKEFDCCDDISDEYVEYPFSEDQPEFEELISKSGNIIFGDDIRHTFLIEKEFSDIVTELQGLYFIQHCGHGNSKKYDYLTFRIYEMSDDNDGYITTLQPVGVYRYNAVNALRWYKEKTDKEKGSIESRKEVLERKIEELSKHILERDELRKELFTLKKQLSLHEVNKE